MLSWNCSGSITCIYEDEAGVNWEILELGNWEIDVRPTKDADCRLKTED